MERVKKQAITDFEKKPKTRSLIYKIVFYLFLLVFILIAGYIFLFSDLTKINNINISGTEDLDPEKIRLATSQYLSGKYFGLFPKNEYFFMRKKSVGQLLANEFKKIDSLKVKKKFPNSLSLEINERKSLIIWCSGGPCYTVDGNGFAYANVDLDSRELKENNLIKVIDESARPVATGEQLFDPGHLNYILGIRDALKKKSDIEIEDEYFTRSRVADELRVKTSAGWDIYLSSVFPIDGPAEMLKVFLDQKIPAEEVSNLEYVDLRVEGKIYYKMKNVQSQTDGTVEKQDNNNPDVKDTDKPAKKKDKN
jgi:hypothetical protein